MKITYGELKAFVNSEWTPNGDSDAYVESIFVARSEGGKWIEFEEISPSTKKNTVLILDSESTFLDWKGNELISVEKAIEQWRAETGASFEHPPKDDVSNAQKALSSDKLGRITAIRDDLSRIEVMIRNIKLALEGF